MANILIVDDDTRCANTVAQHLTAMGHRCAVLQRGKEVLGFLERQMPDLLILDVMLPDLSGFQLCRTIREHDKVYRLPILILSAMNNAEEIEHGLGQGADDYVTKPFQMNNLLNHVRALLDATEGASYTDNVTALPNSQDIKRELQHRMRNPAPFELIYIELTNLKLFTSIAGLEARDKALRHLARALTQCGQTYKEDFLAGHMGAGHFLCVVPPDKAQSFCERIQEAWNPHVEALIDASPVARKKADTLKERKGHAKLLELLCCITAREEGSKLSTHELIDVVSRMHNTRSRKQQAGIHLDRRYSSSP